MKHINFAIFLLFFSHICISAEILDFDIANLKLHMTPLEVAEISHIKFSTKARCDGKPIIILDSPTVDSIVPSFGVEGAQTIGDTKYELKFSAAEFENRLMRAHISKRLKNTLPDWTTIKKKAISKFGKPDFNFSLENDLYLVWTNDISQCAVKSQVITPIPRQEKKQVQCSGQSLHIFSTQPAQLEFILKDAELEAKSQDIKNEVNKQCAKEEAENLDF